MTRQGGTLVDLCCFLEAAFYGKAPIGAFPTSIIVGNWYLRFGTEEQKRRILGGIAAGRVEALALSEPGSGSDVAAALCKAQPVEGDVPSLADRELDDVFLTDCFVPRSAVVGGEGRGWLQIMVGLTFEPIVISALAPGMARRAFDEPVDYVRIREQFGRPVGSFQVVRHRLADLYTELKCCELLVYDAAARASEDVRRLAPQQASMAKLKATETARRVTLESVQLMGAAGIASEYDMERQLRMSLLTTIYGGTSEIQRDIIGKELGL